MNKLLLACMIGFSACGTTEKEVPETAATAVTAHADSTSGSSTNQQTLYSWTNSSEDSIRVSFSYTIQDSVVVGEIIYKNLMPAETFSIIGTIEPDGNYRLLEFEKDGNITNIQTGKPTQDAFKTKLFSTTSRESIQLNLNKTETASTQYSYGLSDTEIAGKYHYQYSDAGPFGDLLIEKLDNNRYTFSILSTTGEPAHNLADVSADTVKISNNSFLYTIPGSEDCSFEVTFFNSFARVAYTNGYCEGWFGMNATVAGIFKKVK